MARRTLYSCCLICHSWLPRARHLLALYRATTRTVIRSGEDLVLVMRSLARSPARRFIVTELVIRPVGHDQAWVSSAAMRLGPLLTNVELLVLSMVDLTTTHHDFYRAWAPFHKVESLTVERMHYSKWSQISRLISVMQPERVNVRTHSPESKHPFWQISSETPDLPPPTYRALRCPPILGQRHQTLEICIALADLQRTCQDWVFRMPLLRDLNIQIDWPREQLSQECTTVFSNLARNFQDLSRQNFQTENPSTIVRITTRIFNVRLSQDEDGKISLELIFDMRSLQDFGRLDILEQLLAGLSPPCYDRVSLSFRKTAEYVGYEGLIGPLWGLDHNILDGWKGVDDALTAPGFAQTKIWKFALEGIEDLPVVSGGDIQCDVQLLRKLLPCSMGQNATLVCDGKCSYSQIIRDRELIDMEFAPADFRDADPPLSGTEGERELPNSSHMWVWQASGCAVTATHKSFLLVNPPTVLLMKAPSRPRNPRPDLASVPSIFRRKFKNLRKLPTEIWERVLGLVAELPISDDLAKRTFYSCCLTCHSWVPRARHMLTLYRATTRTVIRSREDLDLVMRSLDRSSVRRYTVTQLIIEPFSHDQAWVSSAAIRLGPLLTNVKLLVFSMVDLTRTHHDFYRAWAHLCKVESLVVERMQYSRWTQIGRLISVIQPERVNIRTRTSESTLHPGRQYPEAPDISPPSRSALRCLPILGQRHHTLEICIALSDIRRMCKDWVFRMSLLRHLHLRVDWPYEPYPELLKDSAGVFGNLAKVFQDLSRRHSQTDNSTTSIRIETQMFDICLCQDGVGKTSLEVTFCLSSLQDAHRLEILGQLLVDLSVSSPRFDGVSLNFPKSARYLGYENCMMYPLEDLDNDIIEGWKDVDTAFVSPGFSQSTWKFTLEGIEDLPRPSDVRIQFLRRLLTCSMQRNASLICQEKCFYSEVIEDHDPKDNSKEARIKRWLTSRLMRSDQSTA
ncbi:hypothetical protein EIP91_011115 [Steccherinum ochraceum]|uniref:Uncharacterized protein n=1 Tax=Steccherinum ochraceum TaxID=92696 RepID=A0A4R0S3L9_9APHY|nr:hypothetical protein EIP91_011115 [Steccherinum ochraceum]